METILKFSHELVMFFAVALSIGGPTLVFVLAKTDNVAAIRAVFEKFGPLARLIAPLYGVGTLLGVATVWAMDLPWLSTWLVISYSLTVLAAFLGRITGAWATKVGRLAAAEKGSVPGAELKAALAEKAPRVVRTIDLLLIFVFVGLMVFRPSFW